MYLYHYYDKRSGPFRSLTAMQEAEAVQMLERLRGERPDSMCAKRDEGYLSKRRRCEAII